MGCQLEQTMRRATYLMTAAALLLGAATLEAQAKPDFSGSWNAATQAAGGGGRGMAGMAGLGPSATIVQNEKTITITSASQLGEVTRVINLDGSDSQNSLNAMGNMIPTVSRARWEGNKLHISTWIDFNGNSIEMAMSMMLDEAGELAVETSGLGRQGGAAQSMVMKYKKG
jgi:hypothetical protein